MTNVVNCCIMCISIFLISKCHGVGIEYYDDQYTSDVSTEDTIKPDVRRIGNEDNFENSSAWKQNNSTNFNSNRSGKYSVNDNNCMLHTDGEQRNRTHGESVNIPSGNNASSNLLRSYDKENVTDKINSDVKRLPSDIFKEYEYIYDEDTNQYVLRQYSQKPEQVRETSNLENGKRLPLTEFYNLQPAIQNLNLSYGFSKSDNLWYIQEDVPCWELPLLYGELSKMKKYSEIFLIHGTQLKNVIETNSYGNWSSLSNKRTSLPLTAYTSKWCTVEPCYGDHTLCLFSDKKTSSLCGKEYKVYVPTISEQTALVNTLNSMRNKVANGKSERYSYLPPAANMKQVIYDSDLEDISKVWLHQCLPGPAPCSALDGNFVIQLECTKYAKYCCTNSYTDQFTKCTPKPECFVPPVIGCLHVWYWSAGDDLSTTDVLCGHTSVSTYNTVQLLRATTDKIGCAYAQNSFGDVRVICNFSPGGPFIIDSKYYCGIVGYKENQQLRFTNSIIDTEVLVSLGLNKLNIPHKNKRSEPSTIPARDAKLKEIDEHTDNYWGVNVLSKLYTEGWIREKLRDYSNGTKSMIARLVVKYEFIEQNGARCDSDQPIYIIGEPGSLCVEGGRRYRGLCYDYRDPTPGYRLVAVIAPIALFSLILYDLFSGVVRQTNY